MAERIRIQKAISGAGLMSRRRAENAIAEGRVRLDGVLAVLGDRVDFETQIVTLDGVPLPLNPALVTYLLYKPVGVICTADDPHGRRTVIDLIPDERRIWPVGRLDSDTEGLILISNDGELTNRVTHPRYGITKKYVALVGGSPSSSTLKRLTEGVVLEDGPARAESARMVDQFEGESLVELVMTEGRNREVRRMFASVGHEVISLVRTAIGPISDSKLKSGEWRVLGPTEITQLLGSGVDS